MNEAADADPPITYLDHASSTPVRPEVAQAMAPFAAQRYGNASGSHRLARQARQALEEARELVAAALGAVPAEVVFTGGGTEADNLAVVGAVAAQAEQGELGVIVCSAIEHAAVLEPCRALSNGRVLGVPPRELREAPVDRNGVVDLEALARLLGPEVCFVSVMLANNEVGTVQPVGAVARLVRHHAPAATVHTDAIQAVAYLDVATATADADLVSVSAHKIGGPKGVGALVVREGTPLAPIFFGGGQERERRSGTHDVAGAIGLATALELCARERISEEKRVAGLRDRLADGLLGSIGDSLESADRDRVLSGHCHLRFAGCEQEELLVLLDDAGICASAGAACASGALEPSHVLVAMGVPAPEAASAIRFTLGHSSTDEDVDRALATVPAAVARLRR
jgi:cysteine desulfurase